ncbi:MAG: hypothetical protein ABIO94_13410, partial [Opitutaceae bacterium]
SDFWWGRLAPYPYDLSSTESGVDGFGAAYLEAPINIVLLIFLLWNLELWRRYWRSVREKASGFRKAHPPARAVTWILGAAVCWFSLLLVISVSPAVAGLFQPLAPYVQYVYRLVSHCNLALLVAVFASGFIVARQEGYRRFRRETQLVTAVGLTIAVLGVLLKLQHSGVLGKQSGTTELEFAGDRSRLVQKGRAQLAEAYYIPTLVKELPKQESLKVPIVAFPVESAGRRFGQTRPVEVQSKEAGWTVTNAVVFPWTELWVDGNKAPIEQLARQGQFFAILLPAGEHQLEVKWRPDVAWMTLHRISQLVSVLAALGAMGLMGWLYRSRSPRLAPI